MAAPNFVLVSPLQILERNDFQLVNPAIINPLYSDPLLDGEFLEMDPAGTGYVQRATAGVGATHEGTNLITKPVFSERGRSDVQAIGRVTLLNLGMYRAETVLADLTTGGALAEGDTLTVQDMNFSGGVWTVGAGGSNRGLAKRVAGTGTGVVIVGVVERNLGTKVRFMHEGNVKLF